VIENIPGIPSIRGKDLKKQYAEQIKANDIEFKQEKVTGVEKAGAGFRLKTNPSEYEARHIIYCAGTKKRKLNVPGEDELLGRGVCLCATCDAPFFKNKDVAVIGGNDSGATSALLCAEYSNKIFVVEIMDKLPCEPIWLEQMQKSPKIEIITGDSVREISGKNLVEGVSLKSGRVLKVAGVFIEVGQIPDTGIIDHFGIAKDRWGHIEVASDQQTNVDRLYAAGDITNNSNYLRQIVSAAGEGAVAAQAIYKRIRKGE
jgi:thioredoxin reductase (NADPH)